MSEDTETGRTPTTPLHCCRCALRQELIVAATTIVVAYNGQSPLHRTCEKYLERLIEQHARQPDLPWTTKGLVS